MSNENLNFNYVSFFTLSRSIHSGWIAMHCWIIRPVGIPTVFPWQFSHLHSPNGTNCHPLGRSKWDWERVYIIQILGWFDSRLAPSQWETSLQSNAVSHWMGPSLDLPLRYVNTQYETRTKWDGSTWWRHKMETFSALLAICVGNSPGTQRPVTWSFDVSIDLRQNKRLSKQLWSWWFERLSRPLWRYRNGPVMLQAMRWTTMTPLF